ncbi:hypothetical protein ACFE04_016932 [Oxalis oulophora]
MTTSDLMTAAFFVYSSFMSLPEIATNKGYVCHLNPLCKCGVHSVLLTAYTEDNVGKRFFSCASTMEVNISNRCNFFMWFGDLEFLGWAKHLVLHLRTSCNDFESKLIEKTYELAIQKEEMQSLLFELTKTRCQLEIILTDKIQSLEFNKPEMMKLSKWVYDVSNVISGKHLDK